MDRKRAHEPSSTPSATPVIEAASYGGLFGFVAAVGAALVAWVVVRTSRRRQAG